MDRQQILNLYQWDDGICFRHPDRGEIPTVVVKTIQPQDDGRFQVRACAECVIAIEDMSREDAARAGREYEPGRVGEAAP